MLTQHSLSFLVIFLGEYRVTMLQLVPLTKLIFHPNFNYPWQYFITSCWQEKGRGFGQWRNSSIIHNNICSLIHKKCHPNSYHSDIKFHIALNIIFSGGLKVGEHILPDVQFQLIEGWLKMYTIRRCVRSTCTKIVGRGELLVECARDDDGEAFRRSFQGIFNGRAGTLWGVWCGAGCGFGMS